MNRHIETILKLVGVVLFVIAILTTQPYNYYIFLRWFIFICSAYFAYNSRHVSIFGVIILCVIAVVFNPFKFFLFNKRTWHIIDGIVAVMFFFSIDWKDYKESLSIKGELIFNLIVKSLLGVAALVAAFYFVISITGNPYEEYLLMTKGTTTTGFINYVDKEVEDRDAGGETYYYNYSYTFKTTDGKTITSFQQTSGPESQEVPDLSKPVPIDIVYLQSNPTVNKIKDTLSESLFELLWRKIGLGLILLICFSSFGLILIGNAIKQFIKTT